MSPVNRRPETLEHGPTLCRPDDEKSCFGCCPPIRPAGYDHADHRAELTRQLRENTRAFKERPPGVKPITGFSCWALGFLDEGRPPLVGCLLHPARNQGRDIRDLTGYGDKCRREFCLEATAFAQLPAGLAAFTLTPAQGLDSFTYSSRQRNPTFRLLRWGPKVIEHLAALEPDGLTREAWRERWGLLAGELAPERDGFMLDNLLERMSLEDLAKPTFRARYHKALEDFISRRRPVVNPPLDNRPYVHQLGLSPSFARFLKVGLGLHRATAGQALELLRAAESMLAML